MTGRRKTSRKSTSPTMVEVAEAAKVSIFTVSAVVNGYILCQRYAACANRKCHS